MRLVVECGPGEFDGVADERVLVGRIGEVEVTQDGALLTTVRKATFVEGLTGIVAKKLGLPDDGEGPAIRVYMAHETEDEDGNND